MPFHISIGLSFYIFSLIISKTTKEFKSKKNNPTTLIKIIFFVSSFTFNIPHNPNPRIAKQIKNPPNSYAKGSPMLGSQRKRKIAISKF